MLFIQSICGNIYVLWHLDMNLLVVLKDFQKELRRLFKCQRCLFLPVRCPVLRHPLGIVRPRQLIAFLLQQAIGFLAGVLQLLQHCRILQQDLEALVADALVHGGAALVERSACLDGQVPQDVLQNKVAVFQRSAALVALCGRTIDGH